MSQKSVSLLQEHSFSSLLQLILVLGGFGFFILSCCIVLIDSYSSLFYIRIEEGFSPTSIYYENTGWIGVEWIGTKMKIENWEDTPHFWYDVPYLHESHSSSSVPIYSNCIFGILLIISLINQIVNVVLLLRLTATKEYKHNKSMQIHCFEYLEKNLLANCIVLQISIIILSISMNIWCNIYFSNLQYEYSFWQQYDLGLNYGMWLFAVSTTLISGAIIYWLEFKLKNCHVSDGNAVNYSILSMITARDVEQFALLN